MKTNLNKLRSQLNKKQSIAIAIILVAGLAIGAAILGTGTSQPAGDGHGHGSHAESKGHADTEHHGGQATDGHEHAKEHGDAEHHEEGPQTGPHGGKLFAEDGFSLEILLAERRLEHLLAEAREQAAAGRTDASAHEAGVPARVPPTVPPAAAE